MSQFVQALHNRDLELLKRCPKADLHNHFVLGGNRKYIEEQTGMQIDPAIAPLRSMQDMDLWSAKYIGSKFNSKEMRKILIDATFVQAREDGVTVLEIGEDVWGLGEFFDSDVSKEYQRLYESECLAAEELDDIRLNGLKKR